MKTFYIRDRKDQSKNQNVITVVSEFEKSTGLIKFAFAVCSKHDNFNKRLGRELALRRFENIGETSSDPYLVNLYKFNGAFKYSGNIHHVELHDQIMLHVNKQLYVDQQLKREDDKERFYNREARNADKLISNIEKSRLSIIESVKLSLEKLFYGFYHV